MSRALCAVWDCTREARYRADATRIPGHRPIVCARHAQTYAHGGLPLSPIGTCGHVATLADMVARRPCAECRAVTMRDSRRGEWETLTRDRTT